MTETKEHNTVKIMPAPVYLVQYTDGNGDTEVKLAFIVGDEVRFLVDNALSKPAQTWLKNDILIALGMKDEGQRESAPPITPPTTSGLDGTDQV